MRHSIIIFPKKVKQNSVSTTVNPVTQTALVEVKRESIMLIPFVVAFGSSKSKVPEIINIKKLITKTRAGLKCLETRLKPSKESSLKK